MGTTAARPEEDSEVLLSVSLNESESDHRLAAVTGTSTCYQAYDIVVCPAVVLITHVPQSKEGAFVGGAWGPDERAILIECITFSP